jgi:guanylate kinase
MKELWNRLMSRGTETREVMEKRFATAKQEIELGQHFDHFVINDNLERSYQLIKNFLLRNEPLPLSKEGGQKHCHKLLKEFETFKP